MKLVTLTLSLLCTTIYAQITLTSSNFCGANQSYVFSQTLDLQIDYSTTGANHTWDFSNLASSSQKTFVTKPMTSLSFFSTIAFGSFAPAQYKATYFHSTTDIPLAQITSVLPVSITDMNAFVKNETSKITQVGYEFKVQGQGLGFRSDTIETKYVLPLNYGDSYQSRGYTSLDMNPIYDAKWKQSRQRYSSVDGWGSIITPFGQFDALRIHHIIHEKDSIYLSVSGTGMWLPLTIPETHEYEWRSTSDKEAILRIKTNVVLGNEVVTSIEYRDNLLGLSENNNAFQIEVYPNPASSLIFVNSEKEIEGLFIVDQAGKVVKEMSGNDLFTGVDISELHRGTYAVVVKSNSLYSISRFVK